MKLLITGGLGFIGSSFIRLVHSETRHEILNLDKESYASVPESLEELKQSERYKFVKLDIQNYKPLLEEIKRFKPEVILHLAAESHVDNSINNPKDFLGSNIIGTFNLLESIKELWNLLPENFKYIHVSTDEVFGSLNLNQESFTEDSPYKPNSPYSATKASSDLLVRAWRKTYGLPLIITNCSNNYGPWQHPEKLIPTIIYSAISNKKIPIYGEGTNLRDWLHVDDHVRALLALSENTLGFTRYNIGANQEISNLDLANMICEFLDLKLTRNGSFKDLISLVEDRPGHDFRYSINADRIKEDLGFNPRYILKEGINETVDWYIDQKDWLISKMTSDKE